MAMNSMEKIVEEVQSLPETDARDVLDFIGYLKYRRVQAAESGAEIEDRREGAARD